MSRGIMQFLIHNHVVDITSCLLEESIRLDKDCGTYPEGEGSFSVDMDCVEGIRDYCNAIIEKHNC